MISKIKFIHEPYASALFMARRDEAIVTGQPMVEKPYYFQNEETGQLYYDLYGCIGWPSEVTEKEEGKPGYIGIFGIIKPKKDRGQDVRQAKFQLLAEYQSNDVPQLLDNCLRLREEYGFGIQPNLLRVWYGDPERFLTVLALRNEWLVKQKGERAAILVTPPDDFYTEKIFDNYVRALRSVVIAHRIYFGGCEVLQGKLREFTRDDPVVLAAGGLIHSLICRCQWMDMIESNMFVVGD